MALPVMNVKSLFRGKGLATLSTDMRQKWVRAGDHRKKTTKISTQTSDLARSHLLTTKLQPTINNFSKL